MREIDYITMLAYMRLPRAIHWVAVSAILVLVLLGVTLAFYYLDWSWTIYAVGVGILLGLVVGLVILVNVSRKVQIAGVGAVTGMGVDLATTATTEGGPATALNSLASTVANLVRSAQSAAEQTGLPSPLERAVAVGIWVFIGVIAVVMLIGSLEKEAT